MSWTANENRYQAEYRGETIYDVRPSPTLRRKQEVVDRAIRDLSAIRADLREVGITDGEPFLAYGVDGLLGESERIDRILEARDERPASGEEGEG